MVDQVEQVILGVDGVLGLDDLKVRWQTTSFMSLRQYLSTRT